MAKLSLDFSDIVGASEFTPAELDAMVAKATKTAEAERKKQAEKFVSDELLRRVRKSVIPSEATSPFVLRLPSTHKWVLLDGVPFIPGVEYQVTDAQRATLMEIAGRVAEQFAILRGEGYIEREQRVRSAAAQGRGSSVGVLGYGAV